MAQLEQISNFLSKKKKIYNYYKKGIHRIKGLEISEVPNYANNNHWLNLIKLDKSSFERR